MKKIVTLLSIIAFIVSCKNEPLDPDRFKQGVFEIPADKSYSKTIITRIDSIQIEKYEDKIDSFSISWKNNFNYSLYAIHPKTAIDEDPIHVKITTIKKDSYDFEAVIGHSNFVQKGTIIKISN
jgi:hypothetical protein